MAEFHFNKLNEEYIATYFYYKANNRIDYFVLKRYRDFWHLNYHLLEECYNSVEWNNTSANDQLFFFNSNLTNRYDILKGMPWEGNAVKTMREAGLILPLNNKLKLVMIFVNVGKGFENFWAIRRNHLWRLKLLIMKTVLDQLWAQRRNDKRFVRLTLETKLRHLVALMQMN